MKQHIIEGIDQLPQILNQSGISRLFIVTGSHSYQSLDFSELIESLDIKRVFFTDFSSNPLYEQISKGIELFKAEACDGILAIGGGSSIDVAKCIKLAALAKEGNDAILPPLVNARVDIDGRKIPFIAIPTTAGTGSESTHNAVMYYAGAKQTVTNDGILPDYAMLDPSVLKTLPLYQKKCTMMDALCQGIESWWSVNSTDESKTYSRQAVELIMHDWERYIFDSDPEAAAQIMQAANFSGRAINITQTTAAHAMSYKLTSLYGLPHGHAVAVCLPEIWEYMIASIDKCADPRGGDYLQSLFQDIADSMGAKTPSAAVTIFRNLLTRMALSNPQSTDKTTDLKLLVASVNPIRLKNNPIKVEDTDALKLYDAIVHQH